MTCEILQKNPEGLKIYNDFKKPASFYVETEFNDIIPTYNEFISNKKIKEVFGIIPLSKVKDEIGASFPKEVSNQQYIKLKKAVSDANNKIKDYVYLLFNVKQRGQADLYTWGLRKVKGNLDIQSKLDKAIQNATNAIQSNDRIKDLQKKVNQQGIQGTFFQNTTDTTSPFEKMTYEQQQSFEKTIRDLSARMSDRIGISYKIINRKDQLFKGKIENGVAYINLAYATLDTPIHEILGHPIIRAIKNGIELSNFKYEIKELNDPNAPGKFQVETYSDENLGDIDFFDTEQDAKEYVKSLKLSQPKTQLYQNLLKEFEYGKGKEVLDRIKRDYQYKYKILIGNEQRKIVNKLENESDQQAIIRIFGGVDEALSGKEVKIGDDFYIYTRQNGLQKKEKYSLEEQQEEAIVELLGLMTAEKLDNVKDGKLISLLKRLLKEMKQFIRSLINQKEVEIDKLPDNMTLGDLADILAYSNSKLILPGNEVIYTTPDNEKFKTYQEASNHISQLAKSVQDVDLSDTTISNILPKSFTIGDYYVFKQGDNYIIKDEEQNIIDTVDLNEAKELYKKSYEYQTTLIKIESGVLTSNNIQSFIEKNKEYEQSKEIIEEWKKVNNIQYNPEEIYSRGQEFVSVVGAYSSFDVNLMMQNLLSHIEDNEKAGGKFAISAFTKPIDRNIGHLEGGGGKIKFKIYPQSKDILWAANTDVYSGSVWDASEKVNKDKKSELLGVSYTKYPSLSNVNAVQPNLASIVDDLAHHHNELGITLTGNNFRLEYDEDIPYTTKKIIDGINKILDQKYGKLIKPEIKKVVIIPNQFEFWQQDMNEEGGIDRFRISVFKKDNKWFEEFFDIYGESESIREIDYNEVKSKFDEALGSNSTLTKGKGIQPTITKDNLKESIESIKDKTLGIIKTQRNLDIEELLSKGYKELDYGELYKPKEYTEQALINTKIAKLKEVAKKYPRSLIRSEVVKEKNKYGLEREFSGDELPFQKIPSTSETSNNNLQEGLQWLKQIMPDVEPVLVDGLIDNIANGSYDILNDLITLSKDFANKKVVKEEAFHRLFSMLPKSEQEKLLNEGSKKYGIARGKSTATVKYSQADQNKVDFGLKSVEILQSDKAKQVFEKGKKAGWDLNKILTELQIPKEQKQLILDLGKTNREEIITDLLANYSYTIEINTAKENVADTLAWNGEEDSLIPLVTTNTSYYSNLTVPGGTNYTENEIATSAITPSIKGHAQFATDNGIGWFRSDDKVKVLKRTEQVDNIKNIPESFYFEQISPFDQSVTKVQVTKENDSWIFTVNNKDKYTKKPFEVINAYNTYFRSGYSNENTKEPKTRRILEVQSDLFQKGRDTNDLINKDVIFKESFIHNNIEYVVEYDIRDNKTKLFELFDDGVHISKASKIINPNDFDNLGIKEKALELKANLIEKSKSKIKDNQNQFLQLLNKDNNWVTFFVKSIIQDSARKGYEKVLFPTGNTASKVEGHSTLEEFKKQKEDRINSLEKELLLDEKDAEFEIDYDDDGRPSEFYFIPKEDIKKEINQLKEELKRVEREGFGALRPIYNFYENTVTNIVKKQGYNPVLITDEYGNTWNEITITPKMAETIRLNTPNGKVEYAGDLAIEEKMAEEAFNSNDEKVAKTLIEKFIQSIKNLFRNIFKERDNISRLIRNLNQGRFNLSTVQGEGIRYSTNQIKKGVEELFNENPELAQSVYETLGFTISKLPIIDTENIISFEGTKGAAQYDRRNNQIKVNRKFLKQKFKEKAWTKPRKLIETLHDETIESYAQALPENQFTTYEEWEQFVINHEYQHSLYSRQDFNKEFPNKTKGDYESEINRRALNQITPQQKQQAISLYSQYLQQNLNGSVEQFKNWVEEFNRNKTNLEQQSENKTVDEIYTENPHLKDFINSVTDKNDNISIYDVKNILDKHGEGRIVKLNKILYNAINRLWDNNIFAKNNIKIKFVDSLPEDAVGNFNRDANEITIDKRKFLNNVINNDKNYPIFYLGYILNHEIIHYLTPKDLSLKIEYVDRALNGKFGDTFTLNHEREFGKNIKELYDIAVKELNNTEDYGFLNLAEFVAEAMSNLSFQEKLASIPFKSSKQSLWKKFVEILSTYLSLYTKKPITDTLLEAVIAETTNYITENSNIQRTYKRRKSGKIENIDIDYDFVFTTQKNINSLSDFISQKSQERLNAIQEIFNQNPELSKIGDVFSYSSYLDIIFPDSKVKEIVYHGTYFSDAFSETDLTKRNRYFTDTLEYAKGIARKVLSPYILNKHNRLKYRLGDVKIISALLDIKNPQYSNRIAQIMETDNIKDGIIGKEVEDYSNKIDNVDVSQTNSYVVFEPKQIHILSSKADIQGFKDYMAFQNSEFAKYGTFEQSSKNVDEKSKMIKDLNKTKDFEKFKNEQLSIDPSLTNEELIDFFIKCKL